MKPITEAWLIKAGDDLGLFPSGKPTEQDAARFESFADHVYAAVLSLLS